MKNHLLVAALLLSFAGLNHSSVRASENLTDIYANKAQKQKLIHYMSNQIQLHSSMTTEQIHKNLLKRVQEARETLAARDPLHQVDWTKMDAGIRLSSEGLAQLDKESILAIEKVQLQELQTSDNVLFYFTRSTYRWYCGGVPTCDWIFWLELPLCVALDTVFFPVELIESIYTGF